MSHIGNVTASDLILALRKVSEIHGLPFAKRIEQLYRNETAHFKSGNFLKTLSAGMQATKATLPYGWTSLGEYWKANPHYAPTSVFKQVENTSKLAKSIGVQTFMVFPTVEASMMSISHKLRDGSVGAWFSTNKTLQLKYEAELDKIIPRYCKLI
jgi:hypothetical protein